MEHTGVGERSLDIELRKPLIEPDRGRVAPRQFVQLVR